MRKSTQASAVIIVGIAIAGGIYLSPLKEQRLVANQDFESADEKAPDLEDQTRYQSGLATTTLIIGGNSYIVDLPQNSLEKARGLSGRDMLPDGYGMLFDMENSDLHPFWMKDMLFSIDILWLDANRKTVHIERNVSPDTYPKSFSSKVPARYILELSSNSADKYGLRIGDTAEF
ncbi:MAG: hypothetical protein COV07_02090 [Candidatus Vogelbacteria bacterium CG10_big_fil_rev_8_21_14_0_10_45_14]|uniref:DUF192 domain-containing protein n=1 Tax=Candidatus Vogelbacteria bacterium CG10_big_fil_rev_8_21_14_0_10_45_14 TaxID=1975042 RepID=A0A2H0RK15_9BACT|nr:MAG: hypothetical protein COV07_02090 [Candidatus Vogelbacteria bacterium CG10_big_fil_rev_8_21_14_0_10_45_14]